MTRRERLNDLFFKISYFLEAETVTDAPAPSMIIALRAAKSEIYREWSDLTGKSGRFY